MPRAVKANVAAGELVQGDGPGVPAIASAAVDEQPLEAVAPEVRDIPGVAQCSSLE